MADTTDTSQQRALDALINILQSAGSTEAQQAQTILLRRLALEGDVTPSRIPAPRNITEIGGYLNLLADLSQPEMRAQMLAGILGVAGPNPPLGWLISQPALSMVSLTNDRPSGPAQPAIPLTAAVRSDFVPAVQAALKTLHDQGATLPLLSPARSLPPSAPGVSPPDDPLPYLGRTIDIVPASALRDPATDPIALVRAQGTTDPFLPAARVINAGSVPVAPANYDAQRCDATSCAAVQLNGAKFVSIPPVLAGAGFYPATPVPQPTSSASTAWAHFTNVTGLVVKVTKLGDELSLLFAPSAIASSAFADRLYWVWNGTTFAQP